MSTQKLRVVLVGRQDFGKAVLQAFQARGDRVVGVFCAPDKPGAKPDALVAFARQEGLALFQFESLKSPQALEALRACDADIGIMAYVLQFAPQTFVNIPRHGMIQYHPSLLPKYRGPSAIAWALANGEARTGLTIFRPTDGLDEGPIVLQKSLPIAPDATLGSLYFDHLFPMGVKALLEAADQVVREGGQGHDTASVQDESLATYEGWFGLEAAQIHPHQHVDQVYNLIRAGNPSPGAWLQINGTKVHVFDCRKHTHRTFAQVRARSTPCGAKVGEVSQITEDAFFLMCNGGEIEVLRAKCEDTAKLSGAQIAQHLGWKRTPSPTSQAGLDEV